MVFYVFRLLYTRCKQGFDSAHGRLGSYLKLMCVPDWISSKKLCIILLLRFYVFFFVLLEVWPEISCQWCRHEGGVWLGDSLSNWRRKTEVDARSARIERKSSASVDNCNVREVLRLVHTLIFVCGPMHANPPELDLHALLISLNSVVFCFRKMFFFSLS